MSTTETDLELDLLLTYEDGAKYQDAYNAWLMSLSLRGRENEKFSYDYREGVRLRGNHGSLYQIKDEEYCSCLFGALCSPYSQACARTDVDGPHIEHAERWMKKPVGSDEF
jgi:hypothetical protein